MTLQRISSREFKELIQRHNRWLAATTRGAPLADGAQLSLINAVISVPELDGADLANAELVRCRFEQATFRQCDLSYATLIGSDFQGCQLLNCLLVKADLTETDFRGANLTGSDLTRADLTSAALRGADLTGCRLNWAWLIGADLREAIIDGTQFEGTRIQDAKLFGLKRPAIGSIDRAVIHSVDLSPNADGSMLRTGEEAIHAFRRGIESDLDSSSSALPKSAQTKNNSSEGP